MEIRLVAAGSRAMKYSVIVPVRKPVWFKFTLTAILNQSLPTSDDYEIIVVDDCNGESLNVLNDVIGQCPHQQIQYVVAGDGCGRAIVRNLGISYANGDIVIFLDDDCLATPNLLEAHGEYHRRGFSVVMGGALRQVFTIWFKNWINSVHVRDRKTIKDSGSERLRKYMNFAPPDSWADSYVPIVKPEDIVRDFWGLTDLSIARQHPLVEQFGDDLTGCAVPWIQCAGGNLSVNAKALEKSGGFDENFRGWGFEDLEFGYRLYVKGFRFAFGSKAVAFHQIHPRDWNAMVRSDLRNYRYFSEKHDSIVVKAYSLYITKQISFDDLNAIAESSVRGQLSLDQSRAIEGAYRKLMSVPEEVLVAQGIAQVSGNSPAKQSEQ
jgi:glycosyltransferase involved in cell wall biosynthesis